MRETIIMTPGVNESELLRTMARFGKNTLGVRVMGATGLAEMALMRSGIVDKNEYLTGREAPSVIFSFLRDETYFKGSSYADAENIVSALTELRMLITEADEEERLGAILLDRDSEFPEKNRAIFNIYKKYLKCLEKGHKEDQIGLIRAALKANPINADFLMIKEFPMKPLEQALVQHLSKGKVKNTSLSEFIGKKIEEAPALKYVSAYGAINEVNHIISTIYRNGYSLDTCTVACTSPAYAQLFHELAAVHDIPMTFGTGVPVTTTNPIVLLKLFREWATSGFNGIAALRRLLKSEAMDNNALIEALGYINFKDMLKDRDRFTEMAGELRIGCDAEINRERIRNYREVLEKRQEEASLKEEGKRTKEDKVAAEDLLRLEKVTLLAKEFEAGIVSFLQKFTYLRPTALGRDRASLQMISDYLNAFTSYAGADDKIDPVITRIMAKSVCPELSERGALHVTTITGAISSLRKNLFICGLSAANFPGAPKENYLLLDKDFEKTGSETAPTSSKKIRMAEKTLADLLESAGNMGSQVTLSYSNFDLGTLKPQNPSSVMFRLFEKEHPGASVETFMKSFDEKVSFFGHGVSSSEVPIQKYAEGMEIAGTANATFTPEADNLLEREWSPSALEDLLNCPRKFYLARVLGIPNEEDDDPFTVISSAAFGTLVHALLEILGNRPELSEEEFITLSEKHFDEYLLKRPALHPGDIEKEKREFLKTMRKAYGFPKGEMLVGEKKITGTHESGLKLAGFPDRVEKRKQGYVIVDFKTGRKVNQEQDNLTSCFQTLVYAWLVEQALPGIRIDHCEYWYPRLNETATCTYDDNMRSKLNEEFNNLKDLLEKGTFERKGDKCEYCHLKDICEWKANEMIEEEED